MTALRQILARQIAQSGPISIADYMTQCLLHSDHGYYATRDPFGVAGDFTTAPEISQMFGELVGLCLAQSWMNAGAPNRIVLAELGPGRGTLMADILRATRAVPGFLASSEVHLVEASDHLRAIQARTLKDMPVTWHDTVSALPEGPLFLVANEFLDALPIRQFVRSGDQWREKVIGLHDQALCFGLADPVPQALLATRLATTREGDVIEISSQVPGLVQTLSQRIDTDGGAALIIDYGDWHSLGDTFQALQGHTRVDPLAAPGQADLTAHVDFEAVAKAAQCAHTRLTTQGVFLERLGIVQRASSLAKGLTGEALKSHIAAHRRLTHPDEMGTLFKVLGLYQNGQTPPPGLEA